MTQPQVLDDVAASISVTRRIQPTYGYYRQKNGWITVSTITRLERINYLERGWQHLGQYGAFDMTPYVANHPLEALFMFGGAHELPVEQVIQMGFYMDPPMVPRCKQHITQYHRSHNAVCWQGATPVEFPQLANVPASRLGPFPCEFCSRKLPTVEARRQHQGVAHKEELGNLEAGKSLGDSLAAALHRPTASAATPPVSMEMQEMQRTIDALTAKVQRLTGPKRSHRKKSTAKV